MTETQREVFGDALVPGGEDPWLWASKLHFYIPEVAFYNFPTLGKDLESPEFWAGAIDTLREPLAQLEEILPRVLPAWGVARK